MEAFDMNKEEINLDGDVLDNILMDEFGFKPNSTGYYALKSLVLFASENEFFDYDNAMQMYAEKGLYTYKSLINLFFKYFKTSSKRLVKNGLIPKTFQMIVERYNFKKNK